MMMIPPDNKDSKDGKSKSDASPQRLKVGPSAGSQLKLEKIWSKFLIDFDQIMKKYDQNMIMIRIANMIKNLIKILLNMIQCQLTSGPGEKYDYDHGLFLYHHINCICIVHDAIGAGKIMIMMRFLVITMNLKSLSM